MQRQNAPASPAMVLAPRAPRFQHHLKSEVHWTPYNQTPEAMYAHERQLQSTLFYVVLFQLCTQAWQPCVTG